MTDIANRMDYLVADYLNDLSTKRTKNPDAHLSEFLWDNKIGLLRSVQMLKHLRKNDGECLGDHPDWLDRIDAILSGLGE